MYSFIQDELSDSRKNPYPYHGWLLGLDAWEGENSALNLD